MSIAYFPKLYPDELLYSFLARFYQHSAYPRYVFAVEDIYASKNVRPSTEFISEMNEEFLGYLLRKMPLEELIEKHTMFPYHCRFVPKERRIRAFEALKEMKGFSLLVMQQKQRDGERQFLRYCPECVKQDRVCYGEAYFHRIHQMKEIGICPIHKCFLNNSSVPKNSWDVTMLRSLEEDKLSTNAIVCEDEIMCELALYTKKVFETKVDFSSDAMVGKFLHFKLKDTPYLSKRGARRDMVLLYKDFAQYYSSFENSKILERWQVDKAFIDDCVKTYDVCQVAMFLKIPIEELVNMKYPEKSLEKSFDEKVIELRGQGLSYPEIAKRMDASINTIKPIGEGIRGKYWKSRAQNTVPVRSRSFDWEKIDRETLPKVVAACKEIYGVGTNRPHRVNMCSVARMIGIPDKRMALLKLCREEIDKYKENWEEYGAREISWAIDEIERTGKLLNITNIMNLTNMRKVNIIRCIPFLEGENKSIVESFCENI